MRSVDPAYRIFSTARLSIWDILCEKTDQRNADFIWVSDHSVPLLPKHILKARLNILSLALSWALWCCLCCTHAILLCVEPPLKIMALSNSILDSRYVEQTGVLALTLFKAMWNTLSVRLAWSSERAIEAISLALHSVSHRLNASIYCASWGSHDIPLAITSLLVSRVGIHSEASERDFQLIYVMPCVAWV